MSDTVPSVTCPPLEDRLSGTTTSGYWETNEEPEVHKELLKGLKLSRACAICSGGEIGLFTLLPRVRKELVLVDHSYHSLGVCMSKVMLLEQLGPQRTKDLFVNGGRVAVLQAFQETYKQLPESVRKHWLAPSATISFYDEQNLRREWHYLPDSVMKLAVKKLSRVRFIHSDLAELADSGPFDLLYISNALEHSRLRAGGVLGRSHLEPLVKPGGYVLSTEAWAERKTYPEQGWGWKAKRQVRGFRTNWMHTLWKVPTEQKVEEKKDAKGSTVDFYNVTLSGSTNMTFV